MKTHLFKDVFNRLQPGFAGVNEYLTVLLIDSEF